MKLKKCIVGRPGYFDMVNKTKQNKIKFKKNKKRNKNKNKEDKTKQSKQINKCVNSVSSILGYSFKLMLHGLEECGWDLLLKEPVGIKCAMCEQHVKN